MTNRIEEVIFSNLISNEEYCRKVLPFIKPEYFSDKVDKVIFEDIQAFFEKYNKPPTQQVLKLHLDDRKDLSQSDMDSANVMIDALVEKETNKEWLVERTEKFCKEQSLYNAIMESISIIDGNNTKFNKEAIPTLLQEALGVSFDKNIGHDFFSDAERRHDFYHLTEERLSFDLEMFNRITKGGLPSKTLSCVVAGVNTGKSLFLCHAAAAAIKSGKNVLYITLEMAEERIAERIDCNILNIPISDLGRLDKGTFTKKINDIHSRGKGNLIIKEYPTGGAHVGHFKALLNELKQKKNFVPDLILVDYLNICSSQRLKSGGAFNSYTIVKSIAEELRGMAVEFNVPIMTATQFTRSGASNSDSEMTDIAESFGTAATMDFIFALIRTEEMDGVGQILVKQLKSRFGDVNFHKRFAVGVDITRFKLYDVDNPSENIHGAGGKSDDTPAFDKTTFGKRVHNLDGLDFS